MVSCGTGLVVCWWWRGGAAGATVGRATCWVAVALYHDQAVRRASPAIKQQADKRARRIPWTSPRFGGPESHPGVGGPPALDRQPAGSPPLWSHVVPPRPSEGRVRGCGLPSCWCATRGSTAATWPDSAMNRFPSRSPSSGQRGGDEVAIDAFQGTDLEARLRRLETTTLYSLGSPPSTASGDCPHGYPARLPRDRGRGRHDGSRHVACAAMEEYGRRGSCGVR